MIHWFFYDFTPQNPYLSSMIKFALLGTLGEWLGQVLKSSFDLKIFSLKDFFFKAIIWGILGITIKWAFSSFTLLVAAQILKGLLPRAVGELPVLNALFISLQMNIFFAPFMMYLHRFLDNLVIWNWNYQGMKVAIYSIAWFWIPAHTVTFLLPENLRIMFAACLSVILGIILGISSRPTQRG